MIRLLARLRRKPEQHLHRWMDVTNYSDVERRAECTLCGAEWVEPFDWDEA